MKRSFVLLAIGFGTPIVLALLTSLPFMNSGLDRIKPYLVYPSTVGTYYVRPLPWLLGNPPTVGQALYIAIGKPSVFHQLDSLVSELQACASADVYIVETLIVGRWSRHGETIRQCVGVECGTSVDEIGGITDVTLIIKKNTGLTRLLKSYSRLLTMFNGPYPQNPSSKILQCDHVLLIGGGIGITGLIVWIYACPNVKLAWSVKSSGGTGL